MKQIKPTVIVRSFVLAKRECWGMRVLDPSKDFVSGYMRTIHDKIDGNPVEFIVP